MHSTHIAVFVSLATCACCEAQTANLLRDGDFERQGLVFAEHDEPGSWVLRVHDAPDAKVTIAHGAGRDASRCLHYTRQQDEKRNIHLDQLVSVQPNTIYDVHAWSRSDGKLDPVLAIQTSKWKSLAYTAVGSSTAWCETRFAFNSGPHTRIRFEWFPGANGELHTGQAGESWLDDVSITPLENPPPELCRAFALAQSKEGEEIDLGVLRPESVGSRAPLRTIACRQGVLVYDDGGEVALWGVNIQTALSWEWRGRLRRVGIPLEVEALKRVTDENLEHLSKMDLDVVRLHLLPGDFTDGQGNLRDSVYLDVLDYLIMRCNRLGIYVYLTLINEMGSSGHFDDSFMCSSEREKWLFDRAFVANAERYIVAMLTHENRYTGVALAQDPTVAVLEIMNEPRYPTLGDLRTNSAFQDLHTDFERWCQARKTSAFPIAYFRTYRHDVVKAFLTRMCRAVRSSGCAKPVVWNLNWARMINGHEDVFQAVADSPVDAVSVCCYPGQSDVRNPFWKYPADLSGNNYLPYLQTCYTDYSYLRWLLGRRFATKAKLVYEFETMYNHSSHLYPAMAAMFRALGVQIAPMWQYTLTPVAEFIGGSHYLNLYCTPNKAVSFSIAGNVFRTTPRFAPYDTATTDEMVVGHCALSVKRNVALWQTDTAYLQSRATDWRPAGRVSDRVSKVVGCGESPLVGYSGTGVYFVAVSDNAIDIEILPDAAYLRPNWQRMKTRGDKLELLCQLDSTTPHRMELRLEGWSPSSAIVRLDRNGMTPVACEPEELAFQAKPGRYRVTR